MDLATRCPESLKFVSLSHLIRRGITVPDAKAFAPKSCPMHQDSVMTTSRRSQCRKVLQKLVLLVLCLFNSSHGVAQTGPWDFADQDKRICSKGDMIEMNACLLSAYQTANRRMEEEYQRLLRSLADPLPLKDAQVAWAQFRDLQCKFEVPPSWTGSGVAYSRNSCLIDHTKRRIRDLERVQPCNGCVEFKP